MKRILASLATALLAVASLMAQENTGIPYDVFYLMPQAGKGTVYFRDKAPAQGTFNICAVDNTIRYKDKSGQELAVEADANIPRVVIDGVTFLNDNNVFVRLYPVADGISLAVKRDILLMTDSKAAGYGMESQTTAVSTVSGLSQDKVYTFEESRNVPYRMNQTVSLCRNEQVMGLTRRNLVKCFPAAKAEIEAWFAEHKKLDDKDIDTILALCKSWSEVK